jgi:hypothetical protein
MAVKKRKPKLAFALCLRGDGDGDLESRKVYQVLPDRAASSQGMLRVMDESGEAYFYPAENFVHLRLPAAVARSLDSSQSIPPSKNKPARKARIIRDPITGMSVITAGPGAPVLTSKQVRIILSQFL